MSGDGHRCNLCFLEQEDQALGRHPLGLLSYPSLRFQCHLSYLMKGERFFSDHVQTNQSSNPYSNPCQPGSFSVKQNSAVKPHGVF